MPHSKELTDRGKSEIAIPLLQALYQGYLINEINDINE